MESAEFLRLAELTGSRADVGDRAPPLRRTGGGNGRRRDFAAEVSKCDELRFETLQALAFDHLDVAESLALKGIEEARLGEAAGQLGIVLWWRDRLDVSIASYEAFLRAQPALDAPRAALALVLAASGHRTRAVSALQSLAPGGRCASGTTPTRIPSLAVMTEAVYTLDDSDLAAQLRAHCPHLRAPGHYALHRRARGGRSLSGNAPRPAREFDVAFDAFAKALDLELRFGSPTLASQTPPGLRRPRWHGGAGPGMPGATPRRPEHAGNAKGVAFVVRRASELLSTLG